MVYSCRLMANKNINLFAETDANCIFGRGNDIFPLSLVYCCINIFKICYNS